MTSARFERIRELCADLDASIRLAKENHAPVRALSLIEAARDALQRSIGQVEYGSNVVEMKAKGN
jgi:hypothetical protein